MISMIKNHNLAVVDRMAKRSLKGNLKRSLTMIFAVALSSFLLFSVFTVGATYLNMQKLQNIRLQGADDDALLYGGVTEEQRRICENDPDVEKVGIYARAGNVIKTAFDNTPNVGLVYVDEVIWNEMMAPARENVKGTYPDEEDEIMVHKEGLEKCGFQNVDVGDSVTFVYEVKSEKTEKTFRISGMWEGYGEKDTFYVSEQFYQTTGFTYEDTYSGIYHLTFSKKLMSDEEQQAFKDKLNLGKQQRFFFMSEYGNAVEVLTGLIGIAVVTCLCAYLLIYNIMYLSVTGNIRHFGLLQTIGMTGRQVRQLMKRQLLLVGGIGVVGGMAIGAGVSFFLIPAVVRSLGIRKGQVEEITITFHPVMILLAVFLIGITIWIAGRKPTKIAVMCSPIEALGYHPVSGTKQSRKTGKGTVICRMAKEQLTRNKKKTVVVMLSLATSLSVFMCMITLLHSQSAREFYYHYMDLDLVIQNDLLRADYFLDTALSEDGKEKLHILNEDILRKLRDNDGVTEVLPEIFTPVIVPWEPEVADTWMREFYATWMDIPYEDDIEEYKQHPENFGSSLVGITETDFHALNAELETPVDEEDFLSGKTCLLYRNNLIDLKDSDVRGKKILCAEYSNQENTRSFEIAGLTEINDYNALLGMPPTIIVIDSVVKEFVEEPIVFKAGVRYSKEYDEETEQEILGILNESPDARDFSWDSKIDTAKDVKKAQGNMMEIGIGVVFILAFIGMMNYINTSVGNIQSRRREISVMESIGMTGRQVRKMLIIEGVMYAAGTLILTMTAGLGVTYYLYQSMNYRGVAFEFPVLPVAGAAVLILIVCVTVPVLAHRGMEKRGSLVERIREIAE